MKLGRKQSEKLLVVGLLATERPVGSAQQRQPQLVPQHLVLQFTE